MKKLEVLLAVTLVLLGISHGRIQENGIWTGNDYTIVDYFQENVDKPQEFPYHITNGKPNFLYDFLISPAKINHLGHNDDIYQVRSVQRVQEVFTQKDWTVLFKQANSAFTYRGFLKAVAQYPLFCTNSVIEENQDSANRADRRRNLQQMTQQEVCKREVAAILAHMIFETTDKNTAKSTAQIVASGFKNVKNTNCEGSTEDPDCTLADEYSQHAQLFPASFRRQYYERGAIHLRWSSFYARFSKTYFIDEFNGEKKLLKDPDQLLKGDMVFMSAFWHYMTPYWPMPSAHQIMNGDFSPNSVDYNHDAANDFGTTIAVMTLDDPRPVFTDECFNGTYETANAKLRGEIYNYMLTEVFKMPFESQVGCTTKLLDYNGSGDYPSYWDAHPSRVNTCKAVKYPTQFSVYNDEDYKRCVCQNLGDGETSCIQKQKTTCQWTEKSLQKYDVKVPVFAEGQEVELDLYKMFKNFTFPLCYIFGNAWEQKDFYTIQLLQDNLGRTDTMPDFREQYKNDNDTLWHDPPSSMYIANRLGQQTLVFNSTNHSTFKFNFGKDYNRGFWKFAVKSCIDIFQQGTYDCDYGANEVTIEIFNICETQAAHEYPDECGVDPIDPPTPEPDPTDEETENVPEPEPTPTPEPVDPDEEETPLPPDNSPPYFIDFDEQNLYELEQGTSLTIQLSDYVDPDGDRVQLDYFMEDDNMEKWITYDRDYKRFSLKPDAETRLGLAVIDIVLDDGIYQNEYFIQIWVLEAVNEEEEDDESDESDTEEPDPSSPENPDENEDTESGDDNSATPEEENETIVIEVEPEFKSDFDPNTLWAVRKVKERVQRRQEERPVITEQIVETKKPEAQIKLINEIGVMLLEFSQEMLLDDIFAGFVFSSAGQDRVIGDEDEDDDNDLRRMLQRSDKVDLSSLIKSSVVRGDSATSAPQDQLAFKVKLTDYTMNSIELQFEFENPLSLSIGEKPDIMVVEFVEPDLFTSKETGKALTAEMARIQKPILKQFPSETSYSLAVIAGSTIQAAANTAFLSQFGVTICLAVSLKALWNLMHVMQVLAYFRLLVNWPANSQMMLQSVHNAVTLENVINSVYDSMFDEEDEDDEEESAKNAELKKYDIQYKNLWLSLGIFGIFLGFLIMMILLYFLVRLIAAQMRYCGVFLKFLKLKLFYNVWIRLLIESNLKMTHNCIFFLYLSSTFDNVADHINSWLRIILLIVLVIWPIFVFIFIYKNMERLDQPKFKLKFFSMYAGIKLKYLVALTYTSIFCVRRLLLVCLFLAFHWRSIYLLYAYNALSSFYFWYITYVQPHEEAIHNRLELFNEFCLIAVQYLMVFHIFGGQVDPQFQWHVGTATVCLVAFIFFVNFVALVYLAVSRICFMLRVRKARQAYLKVKVRRNAIRKADSLNNARSLTLIQEEVEDEGDLKLPLGPRKAAYLDTSAAANAETQPAENSWKRASFLLQPQSQLQFYQINEENLDESSYDEQEQEEQVIQSQLLDGSQRRGPLQPNQNASFLAAQSTRREELARPDPAMSKSQSPIKQDLPEPVIEEENLQPMQLMVLRPDNPLVSSLGNFSNSALTEIDQNAMDENAVQEGQDGEPHYTVSALVMKFESGLNRSELMSGLGNFASPKPNCETNQLKAHDPYTYSSVEPTAEQAAIENAESEIAVEDVHIKIDDHDGDTKKRQNESQAESSFKLFSSARVSLTGERPSINQQRPSQKQLAQIRVQSEEEESKVEDDDDHSFHDYTSAAIPQYRPSIPVHTQEVQADVTVIDQQSQAGGPVCPSSPSVYLKENHDAKGSAN